MRKTRGDVAAASGGSRRRSSPPNAINDSAEEIGSRAKVARDEQRELRRERREVRNQHLQVVSVVVSALLSLAAIGFSVATYLESREVQARTVAGQISVRYILGGTPETNDIPQELRQPLSRRGAAVAVVENYSDGPISEVELAIPPSLGSGEKPETAQPQLSVDVGTIQPCYRWLQPMSGGLFDGVVVDKDIVIYEITTGEIPVPIGVVFGDNDGRRWLRSAGLRNTGKPAQRAQEDSEADSLSKEISGPLNKFKPQFTLAAGDVTQGFLQPIPGCS